MLRLSTVCLLFLAASLEFGQCADQIRAAEQAIGTIARADTAAEGLAQPLTQTSNTQQIKQETTQALGKLAHALMQTHLKEIKWTNWRMLLVGGVTAVLALGCGIFKLLFFIGMFGEAMSESALTRSIKRTTSGVKLRSTSFFSWNTIRVFILTLLPTVCMCFFLFFATITLQSNLTLVWQELAFATWPGYLVTFITFLHMSRSIDDLHFDASNAHLIARMLVSFVIDTFLRLNILSVVTYFFTSGGNRWPKLGEQIAASVSATFGAIPMSHMMAEYFVFNFNNVSAVYWILVIVILAVLVGVWFFAGYPLLNDSMVDACTEAFSEITVDDSTTCKDLEDKDFVGGCKYLCDGDFFTQKIDSDTCDVLREKDCFSKSKWWVWILPAILITLLGFGVTLFLTIFMSRKFASAYLEAYPGTIRPPNNLKPTHGHKSVEIGLNPDFGTVDEDFQTVDSPMGMVRGKSIETARELRLSMKHRKPSVNQVEAGADESEVP